MALATEAGVLAAHALHEVGVLPEVRGDDLSKVSATDGRDFGHLLGGGFGIAATRHAFRWRTHLLRLKLQMSTQNSF